MDPLRAAVFETFASESSIFASDYSKYTLNPEVKKLNQQRAIDANALWESFGDKVDGFTSLDVIYEIIKAAPTIKVTDETEG